MVADDRGEWRAAMEKAEVLYPPLAPPLACNRCLRPMPPEHRQWSTCYPCGHEHPSTLSRVAAVTYGATETRPWNFYTAVKFGQGSQENQANNTTAIAAALSLAIEEEFPENSDGDDDFIVVPLPSSSGLMARCLEALDSNDWPSLHVVDALTSADRPKQTGLGSDERRKAAADKYTASTAVAEKHVLLLDDAYTSGYTIHDAARAVNAAGALSVIGLVYARRIYPDAMALYREERGMTADG